MIDSGETINDCEMNILANLKELETKVFII